MNLNDVYSISKRLDALYFELDTINAMSEKKACKIYMVDSKADITTPIKQEIGWEEKALEEASLPSSSELISQGYRYGYDFY